jgi:serine/threonine-protein kinase
MKPIRCGVVAVVLILVAVPAVWADYGAIAYSPATGKYGYSYNCDSLAEAERIALRNCRASDATVKVWVENGWAALAVNNNGAYGWGWSTSSLADAEATALSNVSGGGGHILCWCASGN